MSSFIRVTDWGLKALAYSRFASTLGLTSSTNDIEFNPREVALRKIAEKRGNTSVEFISLWRVSPVANFSWDRQRSSAARRGLNLTYKTLDTSGVPTAKSGVVSVKAIPVDLNYEITFWSESLDKITQAVEEYLFWQHSDPNLNISLDVGESVTYPLEMDLHFGPVQDNSIINQQYQKGIYFSYTAPIKVEGWVFDNPDYLRTILKIYIKVYDYTKTYGTVAHWRDVELTEWTEEL